MVWYSNGMPLPIVVSISTPIVLKVGTVELTCDITRLAWCRGDTDSRVERG